jgi:hypothetical protein
MVLCRITGTAPSLLLHPLDFLGADDEPDLAFFPVMGMPGAEKAAFVRAILEDFSRRFQVLPMGEHAAAIAQNGNLPIHRLGPATRAAAPSLEAEALPR